MCLGIPAEIIELLPDERGIVSLGGIKKEISLSLVNDIAIGDYVIVHVGYALTKLNEEEALKTLELLSEIEAFL